MFTALALAAAVGPAQPPAGGLKTTNVRPTVGELGPARKDAKLLPGDVLFIAFDLEGLTIGKDGKAAYTMAMKVSDGGGKLLFKEDPREEHVDALLGGGKVPVRAFITAGVDQPAGTYKCEMTVTDLATKGTATFALPFEVTRPDFGLVAINPSYDQAGRMVAPPSGLVGETRWVHFTVVGFGRDDKTKQPNVDFTLEVFDDKGAPTLGQPIRYTQGSGVNEKDAVFGQRFPVFLTRPGRFVVRVSATDRTNNKRATVELPLRVDPAQ